MTNDEGERIMSDVERRRGVERTRELQLIGDIRKLLPHEKEEFHSLYEGLIHDNILRYHAEREREQLKKKRTRPQRLSGIH